jgi:hypothetical protein
MSKPPKKSAKDIFAARVNSVEAQHAQTSVTVNGEIVQKKVIFESLYLLQRADATVTMEVCEHIALNSSIKTPEGRELLRELGYYKGTPYGNEVKKIVESSLIVKGPGLVFDPAVILEKLTPVERQMMAVGKTNVQEFLQRNAASSAAQGRNERKIREAEEVLTHKPEPRPVQIDRSAGKQASPELRKAYEDLGVKPDRVQGRINDALEGKPPKPFFYDREHPPANPDVKKDDGKDAPKTPGSGPGLKPV